MNRLTERDEYGNADIIALSDVMPDCLFSETNALTEVLNRLAEYEDTGFTPEQIKKLHESIRMIKFNVYAIGAFIDEAEGKR